jgi:hypothetical protein
MAANGAQRGDAVPLVELSLLSGIIDLYDITIIIEI